MARWMVADVLANVGKVLTGDLFAGDPALLLPDDPALQDPEILPRLQPTLWVHLANGWVAASGVAATTTLRRCYFRRCADWTTIHMNKTRPPISSDTTSAAGNSGARYLFG